MFYDAVSNSKRTNLFSLNVDAFVEVTGWLSGEVEASTARRKHAFLD